MAHKELIIGVWGDGTPKWIVVTIDNKTGRWVWTESFRSEAEAKCWLKWA